MSGELPPLLRVLRVPGTMATLSLAEWDLLLRQADHSELTATLLALAEEAGVLDAVPPPVREQFEWQRARMARHRQAVAWEVGQLQRVLAPLGIPLVLLKGAAYVLSGLPPAQGRLFSDIDILVPRERLGDAESALMLDGWISGTPDPYDQRYYRKWMHELPPMQHAKRQTVLDVHHAILPQTASAKPDPARLWAAAQPLPGYPGLHVLSPVDMVLHSAIHLFYEGESHHGLRGLFDLHRLLSHFGSAAGFWEALPARAHELEVARTLFYALRYTVRLLETPVPGAVLAAADAGRPNPILLRLMDELFFRVLQPAHPSCDDRWSPFARFTLYVRGNWLRMPPVMLARHLLHKAVMPRVVKRSQQ